MKQFFKDINLNTNGRKLIDFTDKVLEFVKNSKINNGILNLSILHTSASLIIQENADSDVQKDLLNFFDLEKKNSHCCHRGYPCLRV